MKKTILLFLLICMPSLAPTVRAPDRPYEEIQINEVHSKLIVRDTVDRIYSGQIKSEKGLLEFSRKYQLDMKIKSVDFKNQMLIFGITDIITTRAFRLLKNKKIHAFCLDYYDTGIEYELKRLQKYKKYSYIQVFSVDRIERISHLKVKNLVRNKLSKIYK